MITKEEAWERFIEGLEGFTEDFMAEGREEFVQSEREEL